MSYSIFVLICLKCKILQGRLFADAKIKSDHSGVHRFEREIYIHIHIGDNKSSIF